VPVIGYVGSFVDYEGLDDLVRAAAMMQAEGTDFRLLLVGDGTASEQVRDLIAATGLVDRTALPGRVPHEEVEGYYSLIDICPFPRKPLPVCEVVSPLKPFEALAMGKAVVASDVRALAEIVAHERTGLLFPKGNHEHLAASLTRLVQDPLLIKRLGRAGREWVIAERSWTRAGKLVVEVYDRVLARCGRGSATERAA
jgi:glycosyltransferase involved in cell wall biosynthesis